MAIPYKIYAWFLGLVFLIAVAISAYYQQPYFLAIPFGLFCCIYLVQHPRRLFYVLLAFIPWSIEFNFTPSLGTDLPDEPLMLLTSLMIVIVMIWRRKEIMGKQHLHPLLFIVALQVLWTCITVITSTETILSVKYLLAKFWYLLAFLVTPVFLFREKKVIKRSAIILLCSMVLFMFFALVRHALNGFSFEKINDSLQPFYRNHVNYSTLLVFMVPLEIAAIRLAKSKKIRHGLRCILCITVIALYFSYARGAWLALFAGLFSYWLTRKNLLFFGFCLFFSVCIASVFFLKHNNRFLAFSNDYQTTIFHTNFREHMIATYEMKDVSTAERFYRWIAGVRMIKDRWETGFGPSSFYRHYKGYALPAFKTWVSKNEEHSTVHNYFLLTIIEQGIFGLLFLLALLGFSFWYLQTIYHRTREKFWKVTVAAVAAILIMECTVNFLSDLVEMDKGGSVFYLCLATIIVADIRTRGHGARSGNESSTALLA